MVVVPEIQLFQIEREEFLGDAVVFDECLLGLAPESLQAVDVNISGREVFLMVHIQVPVPAEHQAIVAFGTCRCKRQSLFGPSWPSAPPGFGL